jgi:hypothetical protein
MIEVDLFPYARKVRMYTHQDECKSEDLFEEFLDSFGDALGDFL